jgi:hypothetical protein
VIERPQPDAAAADVEHPVGGAEPDRLHEQPVPPPPRACRERRRNPREHSPAGRAVAVGYQAPFARTTAGIVFSRIDRSRNTDQRSR